MACADGPCIDAAQGKFGAASQASCMCLDLCMACADGPCNGAAKASSVLLAKQAACAWMCLDLCC